MRWGYSFIEKEDFRSMAKEAYLYAELHRKRIKFKHFRVIVSKLKWYAAMESKSQKKIIVVEERVHELKEHILKLETEIEDTTAVNESSMDRPICGIREESVKQIAARQQGERRLEAKFTSELKRLEREKIVIFREKNDVEEKLKANEILICEFKAEAESSEHSIIQLEARTQSLQGLSQALACSGAVSSMRSFVWHISSLPMMLRAVSTWYRNMRITVMDAQHVQELQSLLEEEDRLKERINFLSMAD